MNTHIHNTQDSNHTPNAVNPFAVAFKATADERAALEASEVAVVTVDVKSAVPMINATIARTAPFREAILAQPAVDGAKIAALKTYADALWQAEVLLKMAERSSELPQLFTSALKLRERLITDAQSLAARGVIDGAVLVELKGDTGYANVSLDLLALATALGENIPEVVANSAIKQADIDQAINLGVELSNAVHQRDIDPAAVEKAANDRARAFTLVAQAYDELRRVLSFLRWKADDAETLAPSLFVRKKSKQASVEPAPSPAPTPAPSPPPNVEPMPAVLAHPPESPTANVTGVPARFASPFTA
jgi:hypothetical protein